jgi:HlyD family secretion protein
LRWRLLGSAVIAALTGLGCGGPGEREEYVAAAARRGDLTVTVVANGSLEALDQVNVVADVSGNVTDVYVHVNDSVEAGQPLGQLDPEHWQLMVSRAEAQLATDQANLQHAQEAVKAAELALGSGERRAAKNPKASVKLEELRAAVAQRQSDEQLAASQITVSTAALDTARTALDHTLIRAPMSGVVVLRAVEPGQAIAVTTAAPILFVLARDLRRMELRAFIDEVDMAQLALGQAATFGVDAYPDRRFPARLTSLRNVALRQGNRVGFESRLEVDNSDSTLRPGMTADVVIITGERKGALLVPNAALRFAPEHVLRDEEKHPVGAAGSFEPKAPDTSRTLWAIGAHGEANARRVDVGLTDGAWTEVLADAVQPGENVAVDSRVRRD